MINVYLFEADANNDGRRHSRYKQQNLFLWKNRLGKGIKGNAIVNINYNYRLLVACDTQTGA